MTRAACARRALSLGKPRPWPRERTVAWGTGGVGGERSFGHLEPIGALRPGERLRPATVTGATAQVVASSGAERIHRREKPLSPAEEESRQPCSGFRSRADGNDLSWLLPDGSGAAGGRPNGHRHHGNSLNRSMSGCFPMLSTSWWTSCTACAASCVSWGSNSMLALNSNTQFTPDGWRFMYVRMPW